jgi:regulator of replication initiation timing
MRQVAQPFFAARETRSTRRNAAELKVSSEFPSADVGSASLTKPDAKRKGKGKATDTLRKKSRLADSYLDPFSETSNVLVPEPSLTPAQSDALSLSLNANNLPGTGFDGVDLDPQLSRMGQAAISVSMEAKQLPHESSSSGHYSSQLYLNPSLSEKLLLMPPLALEDAEFSEPDSLPAAQPSPPFFLSRREFLLPTVPNGESSRASSVAPITSPTAYRSSKASRLQHSLNGSPHGVAQSFSSPSSLPFSGPSNNAPIRPSNGTPSHGPTRLQHSGRNEFKTSMRKPAVTSTKKFTFLAPSSKLQGLRNATPGPRPVNSPSLSLATDISLKPSTSSVRNSSHSDKAPPTTFGQSGPPSPSLAAPTLASTQRSIPKLVSDKIAALENTVSNLQREFTASVLKISALVQDHQALLKENTSLKTKLHTIEERISTLENDTAEIEQSVSANTESLSKLDNMFEDLSVSDTRPLGPKSGIKKAFKPVRENVFNVSMLIASTKTPANSTYCSI